MTINILHLLWIVPVSMVAGAAVILCLACIIVGKEAEEEWQKLKELTEENVA
jgi:hypothetical protein